MSDNKKWTKKQIESFKKDDFRKKNKGNFRI